MMWQSLEFSIAGQEVGRSGRMSAKTRAEGRIHSDLHQKRPLCPGMFIPRGTKQQKPFMCLGRGTRPRPLGPAYFPAASFFSSFGSSAKITWPPLSLCSSFLSSLNNTTWPPLSFFSSFLSSEATARLDIVLKLRNATRAINPLKRAIGTSMSTDDVKITVRPCPVHDRCIGVPSTGHSAQWTKSPESGSLLSNALELPGRAQ